MMPVEVVSNGMGAPSMYMMILAGRGEIPCDVVITCDTGSENDCLLSTGERVTAQQYYNDVIEPLGNKLKLKTAFVRARNKDGEPIKPLIEQLKNGLTFGVPMFGSNGGRLHQGCTERYKIRAIRQYLRRIGATTARSALGLTMDEVHRMKQIGDVKWYSVYWPLIDRREYKATARKVLNKLEIPFMLSSECDMCPHKNWARWKRTSPKIIDEIADIEAGFDGTQFFTPYRIPLKDALPLMDKGKSLFDACDSGYCFT